MDAVIFPHRHRLHGKAQLAGRQSCSACAQSASGRCELTGSHCGLGPIPCNGAAIHVATL